MSNAETSEYMWSCSNCRRRKVRCDRQWPCVNCVRGQRDCVFPTTGRAVQRSEVPRSSLRGKSQRSALLDRLRRLETTVDSLNTELENQRCSESITGSRVQTHPARAPADNRHDENDASTQKHIPVIDPEHRGVSNKPRHFGFADTRLSTFALSDAKGGVYVGDRFWATLRREIKIVRETFAELEDHEHDAEPGYMPSFIPSHQTTYPDSASHLFRSSPQCRIEDNLGELRPLPSEMLFIWQTFQDNVSPIMHIFHAPTVHNALQECKYRLQDSDPMMEPLLFALSMVAISTLSAEEVKVNFDRNKEQFMAQLRFGTEQALARANFINTTIISVVQAFTLYLICIRRDESTRYTWSLVGLLIRIAVSIGLHRDGSHFPNISIFETENRRRLWWNICCIDQRLGDSQAPGFGISETDFDTLPPTNLNDEDISPSMTTLPEPKAGFTDSTFSIIRHDKWRLTQKLRSYSSSIASGSIEPEAGIEMMFEVLHDFQSRLSQRFDGQLDSAAHIGLSRVFRVNFNVWSLIIKQQRQPDSQDTIPDSTSFDLAVAILKDVWMILHSAGAERYAWLLRGNMQWQAYAIILSRICSLPWDAEAEEAWKLVTNSLGDVPEAVQADPPWQPLRILLSRTYRHREKQALLQFRSPQFSHSAAYTNATELSDPKRVSSHSLTVYESLAITQSSDTLDQRPKSNNRGAEVNIDAQPGQSLKWSGTDTSSISLDVSLPTEVTAGRSTQWIAPGDLEAPTKDVNSLKVSDDAVEHLDWGDWSEFLWAGAPMY